MEEKYCERCGLYLGVVRPTRRYCSECKRKVDKERHREHERAGVIFKPKKAFCAYCGRPMLKKVASQKYHSGCAKKAYEKQRKSKEEQWLWMQGVELTSEGNE